MRILAIVLVVSASVLSCSSEKSVSVFEDVSAGAGFSPYTGMTYGAAWGDFDGDGLPDLYITNHLKEAKLYRNLGKGKFTDVTHRWFASADLGGDKHGAAWADFDNDGHADLVQMMGAERGVGSERKRLFVNRGDRLEDIAAAAGTANPLSRTRMPLWVDLDRDGRLDLFQGAEARFDDAAPPFMFVQRKLRQFDPSSDVAAFASRNAPFCILTELGKAGSSDLVCRVARKGGTAQVFRTTRLPLQELDLLPVTAFEDIAAGDFDNDGLIDLYLARKNPAAAVSFGRPSPGDVIADLAVEPGTSSGFRFRSTGELNFRVAPAFPADVLTADRIVIGAQAMHPSGLEFSLSPKDAGVAGEAPTQVSSRPILKVGLTPPDKWQVKLSTARDGPKDPRVVVRVNSPAGISDLQVLGDAPKPEEAPARLFMNRDGKLVEESDKRGVNARLVSAVNVVAGDFNNDMHLDLFVVASGDIGKQENLLLLNRGDGRFDAVAAAGGAAGDRAGVGDSVTTVDFDGDGFLDLLVTTGGSMGRSLGMPSDNGGYRLYRNYGNGNHWLEIDLEGTKSNRDGIGARVELTAGGVSQTRVQDGGVHHRGQNHMRLHFGLSKNAQADRLTVRWPSGTVQELTNVQANRILRIKEP